MVLCGCVAVDWHTVFQNFHSPQWYLTYSMFAPIFVFHYLLQADLLMYVDCYINLQLEKCWQEQDIVKLSGQSFLEEKLHM